MKYQEPSFSVALGGQAYREGWERVFGAPRRDIGEAITYRNTGGGVLAVWPDGHEEYWSASEIDSQTWALMTRRGVTY